jgi:hypothetical protein
MLKSELLDQGTVRIDFGQDLVAVIIVVSQRGENFGQGQSRVLVADFFRAQRLPLVLDGDVLNSDPMPPDARTSAADSGDSGDMTVNHFRIHKAFLPGPSIRQ